MAIRTNLCANPTFELNLAGWLGYESATTAINQSTVVPRSGGYALGVLQSNASGRVTATYGTTAVGDPTAYSIPVTAGQTVTVSMYVRQGVGTLPVFPILFWQTASAFGSLVSGSAVTVDSTYQRISITAVAPAGVTKFGFGARVNTMLVNEYFYVDDVVAEISPAVGTDFNGSTVNSGYTYAWTGTPHASTSTETANVVTNLLPNPSFEVDQAGWTTGGFRSNATPAFAVAGTYYLGGASSTTFTDKVPATAGLWYTASGHFSRGSGARTAGIILRFYDAADVELSAPTVTPTTLVTDSVPERRTHSRLAPAGTAKMAVALTSSSTIQVDAFMLEQSARATDYFDGSTVRTGYNYAWSGTPHASSSTQTLAGPAPTINSSFSGSGTLATALTDYINISSGFSGSGTLATALTGYKRISSSFSGSGVLGTVWKDYRNLYPALSGSGTLTTLVTTSAVTIASDFNGSGVLVTSLTNYVNIASTFSGSGTLTTVNDGAVTVDFSSFLFGQGYLQTDLEYSPRFSTDYGSEGVLFTELGYIVLPAPLGTGPLGKRVNYSIGTSAVTLNPAEGSGSAPSVSATYLKGIDPETALGERNVLTAGNIGTYEGEIVNLAVDRASGTVSTAMSTPLTLLNNELNLFPFIDGVASTWTAARAIDYWTQQSGLFYDKVPGACIAYASAYGHNNAYGASTPKHFYEKLTGGTAATTVVNERSVRTFGNDVTGTTAFHEDANASVAFTLLKNQKLIFSAGLGIRGTGRTATVSWGFIDPQDRPHVLTISATSGGYITASVDGVTITTATVAGNDNYRVAVSLERLGTSMVGKLTVHEDDLAGNGSVVYAGNGTIVSYSLPNSLRLKRITHSSSGGSGSQMLRWGTYLTIDNKHPEGVPAIQKALLESTKARGFVSGFQGNVWNMLNEFCSIARLDVHFLDEKLAVGPRITTLTAPDGNFSQFTYNSERRDKYKQVAVRNLQSKVVTDNTAVLWRSDSVYQIAAREVFETTVQTDHSILNLVQPVAVNGIAPFPYKRGGGQYVVTGADGYIISPAWWSDNGGKVEVSLTEKEGEIAIKITAPDLDTVRAPYRLSEGEADRPALYISGSGILNTPKEVHVGTGAKNAKEGFDNVFESPFIAGVVETYDTAMAMASEYSAMNAEVEFEIPNDFDTPSRFGEFPAGTLFTDNVRDYRIQSASQTHSKVSGTAVTHTTIGAFVASMPEGATIADFKARYFGATIRQFNIKPLRGTSV